MKMMMIEAPETCMKCPCRNYLGEISCNRFRRSIDPMILMHNDRPQWCIDKDVEVEDEK